MKSEETQAIAVNGIGSFWYGQDEPRPGDGSYVATEYFVVFYFPVFPMRSARIRKLSMEIRHAPLGHIAGERTRYEILKELPFRWRQILKTYRTLWIGVPVLLMVPAALLGWAGVLLKESVILAGIFFLAAFCYLPGMGAYLLGRARRSHENLG